MKRNIKSFTMLFAALFIYSVTELKLHRKWKKRKK